MASKDKNSEEKSWGILRGRGGEFRNYTKTELIGFGLTPESFRKAYFQKGWIVAVDGGLGDQAYIINYNALSEYKIK